MSVGLPTPPTPGGETPPPAAWLQLLARQVVDELGGERRRGLGPAALRQVEVTATDPAAQTATVILGGDTDNPIDGVRAMSGYIPRAGDVAWCHQNGSDLLLAGGPGLSLPKVKIRKGATSSITSGDTNAYVNFGTPTVYYDRYGMWDEANPDRLTIPWPGAYAFRYHGHWDEAPANASVGRRIAEVEDSTGAVRASDRIEFEAGEVAGKDAVTNPAGTHNFTATQYLRVKVFQSSGGPLSILDEPFSNVFEVTYLA